MGLLRLPPTSCTAVLGGPASSSSSEGDSEQSGLSHQLILEGPSPPLDPLAFFCFFFRPNITVNHPTTRTRGWQGKLGQFVNVFHVFSVTPTNVPPFALLLLFFCFSSLLLVFATLG